MFASEKKIVTFAENRTIMAYTRIDITVKQPSKKLEAFVREMGVKKNEHLETLRDRKETEREIKVK